MPTHTTTQDLDTNSPQIDGATATKGSFGVAPDGTRYVKNGPADTDWEVAGTGSDGDATNLDPLLLRQAQLAQEYIDGQYTTSEIKTIPFTPSVAGDPNNQFRCGVYDIIKERIIFIPTNGEKFNIIDQNTNTTTQSTFGLDLTTPNWISVCLGNDGKAYATPDADNITGFLIIDLENDTATESRFGLPLSAFEENEFGKVQWLGICNGGNGKLYAMPFNSNFVCIIDTETQTAELKDYGLDFVGNGSYRGCITGLDGRIYGTPLNSTSVLIIDPVTDTATQTDFGIDMNDQQWNYAGTGPDGKIYCLPYRAEGVLIIDPATDTAIVKDYGADWAVRRPAYRGASTGVDGRIYGFPYRGIREIAILDPVADTLEFTTAGIDFDNGGTNGSSLRYDGGVIASNGNLYPVMAKGEVQLVIENNLIKSFPRAWTPPYNNN
jgi:hypothetical protein